MYFLNMFRVHTAARISCAPDWNWDTGEHGFSDCDLWVVVDGRGALETSDGTYPLMRGDSFVLRPHSRYIGSHEPSEPLQVFAVHFGLSPDQRIELLPFHRRLIPVDFLAATLDRLLRAHLRGRRDEADRWLSAGLLELRSAAPERERTPAAELERLCGAIRNRPGDRWSVATLAARLGMSHQHLIRLFRREVGTSPKQYIVNVRTESAKAYLRGSSLPVKRIAMILGYHDEFHFSRQFRSAVGMAPTAYRSRTR